MDAYELRNELMKLARPLADPGTHMDAGFGWGQGDFQIWIGGEEYTVTTRKNDSIPMEELDALIAEGAE